MSATEMSRFLAAVDLGSNSFHMVIAEEDSRGNIQFVDRVKEMVRLNAGLDEKGFLSEESQQIAIECLSRFGQRLREIPSHQIRAVGTNTFRAAHNAEEFLQRAELALGHNIAIISGHEEARLVYLGAAFSLQGNAHQRLVIDIGGGSTEIILGQGYKPMTMHSHYMGCVSMTRKFFQDGIITTGRIEAARDFVLQELEPVMQNYKTAGWQEAVGTSGTMRAADTLSRDLGIDQDWLSRQSMSMIQQWLVDQGHQSKLALISEQRRPVFAGGYCIISGIFEALKIEHLECASGALREGVLYELSGRLRDEDSRDMGVNRLIRRFGLDQRQIDRVLNTALGLFDQVVVDWKLDHFLNPKLLAWAAQLHEIGTTIAFSQHHKHGSYIAENLDIEGFSRQQQRSLALLIRSHRQKFPSALFQCLANGTKDDIFYLAVLIRLACAFNRGRTDDPLPKIGIISSPSGIEIMLPHDWSHHHPLTILDLNTEKKYLSEVNFDLQIIIEKNR